MHTPLSKCLYAQEMKAKGHGLRAARMAQLKNVSPELSAELSFCMLYIFRNFHLHPDGLCDYGFARNPT